MGVPIVGTVTLLRHHSPLIPDDLRHASVTVDRGVDERHFENGRNRESVLEELGSAYALDAIGVRCLPRLHKRCHGHGPVGPKHRVAGHDDVGPAGQGTAWQRVPRTPPHDDGGSEGYLLEMGKVIGQRPWQATTGSDDSVFRLRPDEAERGRHTAMGAAM